MQRTAFQVHFYKKSFMPFEIIFKNGIFFTLFLSMLSFWGKSFQSGNWSSPNSFDPSLPLQSDKAEGQNFLKFFNSIGLAFNTFKGENFFLLSFFFITSELLFRWFRSGHPPLSNLYESLLFFSWGLIGFFLFWDFRLQQLPTSWSAGQQNGPLSAHQTADEVGLGFHQTSEELIQSPTQSQTEFSTEFSLRNFFGAILSSAALFLETFADWRLPSEMKEMKPLIPALQSNWLLMHVSIMILSYAALLIGCLLAISYIALSFSQAPADPTAPNKVGSLATGNEVGSGSDQLSSQMSDQHQLNSALLDPGSLFLRDLDSLSFRVLAFGFPLLTLGILSGAVWANEAWGSYWSWDPKETWAFITWLIFAFYLHTRLQYGWEGKKSAFVATFGFFILWICYLGVNLLGKGLHSYGWLS